MPCLDSHPDNELGTGVLPDEAKLIAAGMVFARRLTDETGHTFILCGQRPFSEFVTDMVHDARKYTRARPVPTKLQAVPAAA